MIAAMNLKPITTKVTLPTVYDTHCRICGHKIHMIDPPKAAGVYWCEQCRKDANDAADFKVEQEYSRSRLWPMRDRD
jgi:hypothetical protein